MRSIQQQSDFKTMSRSNSPKVESSSCSQAPKSMPKMNDVVPFHGKNLSHTTSNTLNLDDGELIATSSYKWKCQRCTYLNFTSAIVCTMCRAPSHISTKPGKRSLHCIQLAY